MPPGGLPEALVDASTYCSLYLLDEHQTWAARILNRTIPEYIFSTCDLCVGEVVTQLIEASGRGDRLEPDALLDFARRLQGQTILRITGGHPGKISNRVQDLYNIQLKDKLWLLEALRNRIAHVITTDRGVWEDRRELRIISLESGGPGLIVHAPYDGKRVR